MSHPLTATADLIQFNTQVLSGAVSDFGPEDWAHRCGEGNPALWIVGHVAVYRRAVLRELGETIETAPWEKAFQTGASSEDSADPPDPQTLLEDAARTGLALHEKLSAMTDAQAKAPRQTPFGPMGKTDESYILFMFWHESYHVGQLGLIRRALGKPGLA